MSTTTTTTTDVVTGITAQDNLWSALGCQFCTNKSRSCWPSNADALLAFGVQATGEFDDSAVRAAIVERDRRNEECTRVTAQARLADALKQIANQLAAETAEALVERMPAKIRPYAEAVLRGGR